jgi:protein NirF
MNKLLLAAIILASTSCSTLKVESKNEKIYVVERERESLSVIKNKKEFQTIKGLGNLNHATMKFKDGFGYVLARDGFISKIDVVNDQLVKKVKVGKSGIGITFTESQVVIVNYDPNSVVVLDLDLNVQKVIETNSRNVGVKYWNGLLVFSLMDKNEIWVVNTRDDFKVVKKIENVGQLPFDALIKDHIYLVGFFNEASVGVMDLRDFTYKKVSLSNSANNVTYKVPHFGTWGIIGNTAIVPIASNHKLLVLDLKEIKPIQEIDLIGSPVFATVSPDKDTVVVSYSGEQEDYISVVDTKDFQIKKEFKAGQRVMHFRYSSDGRYFYLSSYFENKVHIFGTEKWEKIGSVAVSTPSGIFIKGLE